MYTIHLPTCTAAAPPAFRRAFHFSGEAISSKKKNDNLPSSSTEKKWTPCKVKIDWGLHFQQPSKTITKRRATQEYEVVYSRHTNSKCFRHKRTRNEDKTFPKRLTSTVILRLSPGSALPVTLDGSTQPRQTVAPRLRWRGAACKKVPNFGSTGASGQAAGRPCRRSMAAGGVFSVQKKTRVEKVEIVKKLHRVCL